MCNLFLPSPHQPHSVSCSDNANSSKPPLGLIFISEHPLTWPGREHGHYYSICQLHVVIRFCSFPFPPNPLITVTCMSGCKHHLRRSDWHHIAGFRTSEMFCSVNLAKHALAPICPCASSPHPPLHPGTSRLRRSRSSPSLGSRSWA